MKRQCDYEGSLHGNAPNRLLNWIYIMYNQYVKTNGRAMPKRSYVSSVRASAAAETRERIIAAGARLLRKDASIANFSLDVGGEGRPASRG
ncbi:hypothetical protein BRDID11002_39920 [Bradyrhizobium diazoefficiens]